MGGLEVIKLVLIGGLTLWLTLAAINNIIAFRNGAAAVGMLMGMQLLKQPPVIKSPLQSRAIEKESWHTASFAIIVVLEVAVSILLWWATILVAQVAFGANPAPAAATVAVNRALAALLALLFLFMIGGTWFAYYIKQETLGVSHVAMIGVIVVAAIFFNIV